MQTKDVAARLIVLRQRVLVLASEIDELFQELLDTEEVEE